MLPQLVLINYSLSLQWSQPLCYHHFVVGTAIVQKCVNNVTTLMQDKKLIKQLITVALMPTVVVLAEGVLLCVCAVSYTHLDVYKRQGKGFVIVYVYCLLNIMFL